MFRGIHRRQQLQLALGLLVGVLCATACSDSARPEARSEPDASDDERDPPDASRDASHDDLSPAVDPELVPGPVNGIDFFPLETLTQDEPAQTVAHMELTGLLFLPDDEGVLVWEKTGHVFHYRLNGDTLTRLGEFKLEDVETQTDCGLISIALDPEWQSNRFIWASHCISSKFSAVTRFRFAGGDYERVVATGQRVIEFGDRRANRAWHNIGTIGFFPDDAHSMWILAGDKVAPKNAQDPTRNLGGVLRIIPDRTDAGGYTPHPDNPFGGPGSDPELQSSPDLYAWGLRSPWRGSVDALGRIWIGEVGQKFEEINLARKPAQNFGWGKVDGPCSREEPDHECDGLTEPVVSWSRSSDHPYRLADDSAVATSKRVAWVGVPYTANSEDPYEGFLDDTTLVSDICIGFVRAVSVDAKGRKTRNVPVGHLAGLSGATQGPDGSLYVTSFGGCTSNTYGVGGGIYRVIPRRPHMIPPEAPADSRAPLIDDPLGPMPPKLEDTGIFADDRQQTPIARAIRYRPSLPLWSNGSSKDRWLLLPEGTQIDNTDRANWVFPVGTLFFKTFRFDIMGKTTPVETRILRRLPEGWDYQTYMWQGDSAGLLSLERKLPVRITREDGDYFDHSIPSRFDCRACHESNPSTVIGFDELRLSGALGTSERSQLQELARRGVFTQEPPSQPESIEADAPDHRTRAVLGYLHGNCAHCHNASPNTMSQLDLTHSRALANMLGMETEGSGQAAGIRVLPGAPLQSVVWLALAGERGTDAEIEPMPPIGVQLRDAAAIALLEDWIAALPP